MFRLTLVVSLLVCMIVVGFNGQTSKLQVTVLYESLCPDSIRFITNQLSPNFESLEEFIDVNFVPFGKSDSYNDGLYFECQHGPEECYGNMVQSCVLHRLTDPLSQVDYVTCQMNFDAEDSGLECAEEAGIPWYYVKYCMLSGLGRQLQLEAERVTKQRELTFVPTIMYENQFDEELQNRSLVDFRGVVCELTENAASACKFRVAYPVKKLAHNPSMCEPFYDSGSLWDLLNIMSME